MRKMRDTHSNAKSGLPISVSFMPLEVKIPIRHPIKFTQDSAAAILPGNTLSLLGRSILREIAEHINSRKAERLETAHHVTGADTLTIQLPLGKHVPGKKEVMLLAPFADLLKIGLFKARSEVFAVTIPRTGKLTICRFPHKFRQC